MPDVVNIKNGEGITLTIDGKKIKIDSNLTEDEIKSITADHIKSLMAYSAGFPKLFTTSKEYIIPITGRYRIQAVGGGGGGTMYKEEGGRQIYVTGGTGGDTKIIVGNNTYVAKGGIGGSTNTNFAIPENRFNGISGSTHGGVRDIPGENGYGICGINYRHGAVVHGGGAGSPLNYNANRENSTLGDAP